MKLYTLLPSPEPYHFNLSLYIYWHSNSGFPWISLLWPSQSRAFARPQHYLWDVSFLPKAADRFWWSQLLALFEIGERTRDSSEDRNGNHHSEKFTIVAFRLTFIINGKRAIITSFIDLILTAVPFNSDLNHQLSQILLPQQERHFYDG